MKILAIETSCDETAVAVLEINGTYDMPEFSVLGSSLYSQAAKHAQYGGVYPTLAKREHSKNLVPLLKDALQQATMLISSDSPIPYTLNALSPLFQREPELLKQLSNFLPSIKPPPIDAIAVTQGPGLEPALWVGLNFAKALSIVWNVPFIPVNHMEGHIMSVLIEGEQSTLHAPHSTFQNIAFPALALLVSGGHTELVYMKDSFTYEVIGQTRDDAVGEAFDKVARMLGLPYPGGPHISQLAEKSRDLLRKSASDLRTSAFELPRPMINSDDYDFSYSGLKTSVLYKIKDKTLSEKDKQEMAREFEDAALDVLIAKTKKALQAFDAKTLIISGGVVANKELRRRAQELILEFPDTQLLLPTPELATDNAVMIGIAGGMRFLKNPKAYTIATKEKTRAEGNLRL